MKFVQRVNDRAIEHTTNVTESPHRNDWYWCFGGKCTHKDKHEHFNVKKINSPYEILFKKVALWNVLQILTSAYIS